eukprot:6183259-Pleurochrysis_carterae.AAC.1
MQYLGMQPCQQLALHARCSSDSTERRVSIVNCQRLKFAKSQQIGFKAEKGIAGVTSNTLYSASESARQIELDKDVTRNTNSGNAHLPTFHHLSLNTSSGHLPGQYSGKWVSAVASTHFHSKHRNGDRELHSTQPFTTQWRMSTLTSFKNKNQQAEVLEKGTDLKITSDRKSSIQPEQRLQNACRPVVCMARGFTVKPAACTCTTRARTQGEEGGRYRLLLRKARRNHLSGEDGSRLCTASCLVVAQQSGESPRVKCT